MLDRTIPFCNTILKCSSYSHREVSLPPGYTIVSYQKGFEKAWAGLEYAVGDFDSPEEAERYFTETYLQSPSRSWENIRFLLNCEQEVIGSCIAWQDPKEDGLVPSLHWLVLEEACQGKGLGKSLCIDVMNRFHQQGKYPVYIHTQPWSWKAISLYISLGFRLQRSDTFANYTNEYTKAMAALKNIVTEAQFSLLLNAAEA